VTGTSRNRDRDHFGLLTGMTSGSSVTASLIRSLPGNAGGSTPALASFRGLLAVDSPRDLRAGRVAIATLYAGGSAAFSPPPPARLATPMSREAGGSLLSCAAQVTHAVPDNGVDWRQDGAGDKSRRMYRGCSGWGGTHDPGRRAHLFDRGWRAGGPRTLPSATLGCYVMNDSSGLPLHDVAK